MRLLINTSMMAACLLLGTAIPGSGQGPSDNQNNKKSSQPQQQHAQQQQKPQQNKAVQASPKPNPSNNAQTNSQHKAQPKYEAQPNKSLQSSPKPIPSNSAQSKPKPVNPPTTVTKNPSNTKNPPTTITKNPSNTKNPTSTMTQNNPNPKNHNQKTEPNPTNAQKVPPSVLPPHNRKEPDRPVHANSIPNRHEPNRHEPPKHEIAGHGPDRRGHYAPPERPHEVARAWHESKGWRTEGAWRGHREWTGNASHNWVGDHRSWFDRGGYGGIFIPPIAFGLFFGAEHCFRMAARPVIVDGYPHFKYGGYTFMLVDPWPAEWGAEWFGNNELYVDYDDGYYLHNTAHPDEALAVTIVQ